VGLHFLPITLGIAFSPWVGRKKMPLTKFGGRQGPDNGKLFMNAVFRYLSLPPSKVEHSFR
jgi:hypothetical protein